MEIAENFGSIVLTAWEGKLTFPDLIDFTARLELAGLSPLAAVLYQTWLSRTVSPYAHAVNFNLGATLTNLGDLAGAEAAYRRALAMAPTFAQPRLNLGLLFERAGQVDAAMAEWNWIVGNCPRDDATKPLVQLALNHLGRVMEAKKQFPDADGYLTQSLLLEPNQPDVLHHWVFLRQKQCAWPVYPDVPGVSKESMREATSALAMLSISDDPQEQLRAAEQFVETKLAKNLPHLTEHEAYGHRKLRIAYCSSDFCLHPVSLLTVQMFELHNRELFEVYGFCWSPEDGSATRQRVKAAMDHFFTIHQMTDEEAAHLIRSHEIDILIDLQGQTSGARANILAYRPAPIQITYLGLPATTGFPFIDYVIADDFLIPPAEAQYYSEKPLYMPHIYQVSDRRRQQGPKPTRASCGLPEQGFVFCSFNNSYKYTPEVFDVWLSLLRKVPGSVLWLLADNPWAESNLRKVAESRGFTPDRLVFATRVSPENYLARYLVADLFLDTFPFNAGTTANDCLWMGCPLVTMTGRSFGARMAGALLTAAGLPELITYNLADYEAVALRLANDPARCAQLRTTLGEVREHGVLFDTPAFVRDLETRLVQLVNALPAFHGMTLTS
jgi:predicted O-linked N-acetylglucosamine transferase (SPINDLY family)